MSCGASWHRTSCHVGQVSIGQVGIGPIDLGQIVLTPYTSPTALFPCKIQRLDKIFSVTHWEETLVFDVFSRDFTWFKNFRAFLFEPF